MNHQHNLPWPLIAYVLATAAILFAWTSGSPRFVARAQDDAVNDVHRLNSLTEGGADQEMSSADAPIDSNSGPDQPTAELQPADVPASQASGASSTTATRGLNLFTLLSKAGWFFMVPIWIASIAVAALAIERLIALRRGRVMPNGLVVGLGKLAGAAVGFDPRAAYRLCQQFPSAASTVVRAMLLKVGRPHSEVEHAVREASDREANRLYARVRWLSLAAAVAPLWGLLGTVWGMMMAFYDTTQLGYQHNKAEALAEGIYTALVTTLCGLFIAIPSAIMAHYLEGRIHELFRRIDELLFTLLPQIERYEGRVRFNRQSDHPADEVEPASADMTSDHPLHAPSSR